MSEPMVWEFQCPIEDCEYADSGTDEDEVLENAQQHVRDQHGDMPTQDEIERHVIGPG